jgi:hypothetical protein
MSPKWDWFRKYRTAYKDTKTCLYLLCQNNYRNLYCSPGIIRIIKSRRTRWAGNVARMGEKRNEYRILVGKSKGKRPLGRPRRRWKDNIRIDLREILWGGMDWIDLAQDRDQWRALVNTVKCWEILE